MVKGSNNSVKGKDNFVVGSGNNIKGRNSWIFASQISAKNPLDGVLIADSYLIELSELLQRDARILNSISCSNPEENRQRVHRWCQEVGIKQRFTCK